MSKRNAILTAEKGKSKNNDAYDLCASDILELVDHATVDGKIDMWELTTSCFNFGYVLGGRAVSKGAKVL